MKWILAHHLETWAETKISRDDIAALIAQLVSASAPRLDSFRFPSGDSSGIPGYDGHLIATGVAPYIPDGESVWEFGTGRDYLQKANDDYKKRSIEPLCVDPSQATFVFVTPRKWDGKVSLTDWESEKNAERQWKQVRAIDAVALEDWLERHEAVAKDVARNILGQIPETGVRSVREFWEEYSEAFAPVLQAPLVLCGRQEQADGLVRQLASGNSLAIKLQADSADEVVAFAVAAIRTADPTLSNYLSARTLIIDTEEAARRNRTNANLIFFPTGAALNLSGSLANRAPTLIPLARDEKDATRLLRPSSYEFSRTLHSMGLPEEESERRARECGRSVTILARRIPAGRTPPPPWVADRQLLPALFAGGWNAGVDGDREAISQLAGLEYPDFEERLVPLLAERDPLEREGSVWNVRAPLDAFDQLGHLITRRDLDRLGDVVKNVFGEVDPRLDLSGPERLLAGFQGKMPRYSDWLRDGLATTLLHLALLHEQSRVNVTGTNPEVFVDSLVRGLPGLKENSRLLASLGRQLPWLMEAAPHPLLEALEHLLGGDGSGIRPIFEEHDTFFPSSSHTELLWALERLAWDPGFLKRVTLDLAKLAVIDPGGRTVNRPINSLNAIFKPWMPQTNATLQERLAAIDQIVEKVPGIGWDLLLSLLPPQQDSGMSTSRPRLRDSGEPGKETLTQGLVNSTYYEVVQRATKMAGLDPARLLVLVQSGARFAISDWLRICDEIEKLVPSLDAEPRNTLWSGLRDVVNLHISFHEAEWALPQEITERLKALRDRLEPDDLILKVKWLFDKHFPDVPDTRGVKRPEAADVARNKAAKKVYDSLGEIGIVNLASNVEFAALVAISVTPLLMQLEQFERLIDLAYEHGISDSFMLALSSVAHDRYGDEWSHRLAKRAREGFDAQKLATLVSGWTDEPTAWNLVASFGREANDSYWSRRLPFTPRGDSADLERAGRQYLSVGRPWVAIEALAHHADHLPEDLIFAMLDDALKEPVGDRGTHGMLSFWIETIFDKLDSRNDVAALDIARREYAYLPLLKHNNRSLALHQIMARNPGFFVDVLCDVFKPGGTETEVLSDEVRTRARHSFQLLSSLAVVPGFVSAPAQDELNSWVVEARRLATNRDREKIGDEYIGQLIARAPADPDDGAWPHKHVRVLLERLESGDIESGIATGRYNLVGVHAIDPKKPAALQRQLATQADEWAAKSVNWPRTEHMLREMAAHWRFLAEAVEERARQDAMREG